MTFSSFSDCAKVVSIAKRSLVCGSSSHWWGRRQLVSSLGTQLSLFTPIYKQRQPLQCASAWGQLMPMWEFSFFFFYFYDFKRSCFSLTAMT